MASHFIKKLQMPREQREFLRGGEQETDVSYQPPSICTREEDVGAIHFVYPDQPPGTWKISGPTCNFSKYPGRIFHSQALALAWARANYDWVREVRQKVRGTWCLEVKGWHGRGEAGND